MHINILLIKDSAMCNYIIMGGCWKQHIKNSDGNELID